MAGWTIDGTTYTGVQLTSFQCAETPVSTSLCGALTFTARNVQYYPMTNLYLCHNTEKEEMKIVTTSTTYYGSRLQCVSGAWQFTGSATVPIPAGSSVSCYPFQMAVLPAVTTPPSLIYAGQTTEGLSRWTCIDSTLTLDIEYAPERGKNMPVHAAYIDCNNTFYRFSSSINYQLSSSSSKKINSLSCVDLGAKHYSCSDPWDIGGIRNGNRYECMKGYFLQSIGWVDQSGNRKEFTADATDTKSMQCNKDGWQIEARDLQFIDAIQFIRISPKSFAKLQGSSLSGLRISDVNCWDANPEVSSTQCKSADIQFENYKLKFDFFRKLYTCYGEETIGYTLNSVRTLGGGRKLFCGKSSAGAWQWQWSLMDGSQVVPIPIGAKMSCFVL